MTAQINVLDHGYVRFVEAWGHGDAGHRKETSDFECGIVEAARQSTQASFRGWEQDEKLLRTLFCSKPPHATPFEFAGMVIEVQAPIFVFREWHRHRTQSYNEMSARYAPLPDLNYVPTAERCLLVSTTNKQAGAVKGSDTITPEAALQWLEKLGDVYTDCELTYQDGLKRGIPKEIARTDLPVGRYSRMRACANLRNWLAFMTLRADPGAQWEIQQYANAVGVLLAEHFPKTWGLYQETKLVKPIPLVLHCPKCGLQHVDKPEAEHDLYTDADANRPASICDENGQVVLSLCKRCGKGESELSEPCWTNPPHKSHLCHGCGTIWRPADVPTVGVKKIATRGSKDTYPPL